MYIDPNIQFIGGYIDALKAAGVTVPITTIGYEEDSPLLYVYLEINDNDVSSKNTQNHSMDIYVNIVSVNMTSMTSNLEIQGQVKSLCRIAGNVAMADFESEYIEFVGDTTNTAVDENKRYFQKTLRFSCMINKK